MKDEVYADIPVEPLADEEAYILEGEEKIIILLKMIIHTSMLKILSLNYLNIRL